MRKILTMLFVSFVILSCDKNDDGETTALSPLAGSIEIHSGDDVLSERVRELSLIEEVHAPVVVNVMPLFPVVLSA